MFKRGVQLCLFLIVLSGCSSHIQTKVYDPICQTKYPIVLVHGIAATDDFPLLDYWKEIPEHLRAHGAKVYLSGQKAYASHSENAALLKERVLQILQSENCDKVNLVAVSKGGLESRYMISKLDMASHVSSLTTISTPHRGSGIADIVFEAGSENIELLALLHSTMSIHGIFIGDSFPSPAKGGYQLTTWYMKKFNEEVKDKRQVYYRSYAASISKTYPSSMWVKFYEMLYEKEGANDGMVSVKSAKWGDYKGVITTPNHPEISHSDLINMHEVSGVKCEEIYAFYITLAAELKELGH